MSKMLFHYHKNYEPWMINNILLQGSCKSFDLNNILCFSSLTQMIIKKLSAGKIIIKGATLSASLIYEDRHVDRTALFKLTILVSSIWLKSCLLT